MRTKADRDFDLQSGREIERKDAEIERLSAMYAASNAENDELREEGEKMRAALNAIERKYTAVMRDPPDWVRLTPEQLKWVREAWYGASLIARAALGAEQKAVKS